MKMKKIFYFILGMIVSVHSFAAWQFQGQGRVIDEHQGTTGGAIGGGLIDSEAINIKPSLLGASASAMAVSASGYVNQAFNIFGQHSFYIKNTTMSRQRYSYYYQLCAENTKCFYYNATIELDPGSIGQNQATTYVAVQFSQPGTYHSQAETRIAGEQTAISGDMGFISIFKP